MTRILIVDDEPTNRETFCTLLEEGGYEVDTASDSSEAAAVLTEHACDVVLADLTMVQADGLDPLGNLGEGDVAIPLVILTREPDGAAAAAAMRVGAYDYLNRPITPGKLMHTIGRAVERKRLLDERKHLRAEKQAYQEKLDREVARRTDDLKRSNQELDTLTRIGREVSATLDLQQVLKRVTQLAANVCGAHRCTIVLIGDDGEMLTSAMSAFSDGHRDEAMWHLFQEKSYPVPLSEIPEAQQVVRQKSPLFIPDAPASSLPKNLIDPFGIKSVLLVPLISKQWVVGLMALDHVEEGCRFTDRQVDVATSIAAQATLAIENARLYKQARRQARYGTLLNVVAQQAATIMQPERLLSTVARTIHEHFGYDSVILMLVDGESGDLTVGGKAGVGAEVVPDGYRQLMSEGIIGWVARQGEHVVSNDAEQDELYFAPFPDRYRAGSELAVPLKIEGQVIGVLDLQCQEKGQFDELDIATAHTLAGQIGTALQNARLYEAAQQRVAELEALRRAGLHVTSSLELQPVLEAILESALQLVQGADAHIFLYEDEELSFGAARWAGQGQQEPYAEPRQSGVTYTVARSGERLVVPDAAHHELYQDGSYGEWAGAIVSLPLKIGDQVQGVMNVAFNEPHAFSEDELNVLGLLADQAAIAVENARLYKEAQRHVEELTALHNIDLAITSTLSPDEVLERVYEQLGSLMDVTTFYIGLYDEKTNQLHISLIVDQGDHLDPLTLDLQEDGGFAGWVVRNKEPLWIDHWAQERETLPVEGIARGTPTQSLMVLPLLVRGELIGVISAQSYRPYSFGENDRRLFSSVSNQVAIALENARLFEEVNRRLKEMRSLQRIIRAASSTLDFDKTLNRTVETLRDTLGVERLTFASPSEDESTMVVHPSTAGLPSGAEDPRHLPMDESVVGRAYRSGEPLLFRDVSDVSSSPHGAPATGAVMAVPVWDGDEIVAVLNAESTLPQGFDEDDLSLFSAVAAQLGVALKNARLFEQTRRRLTETRLLQEVMRAGAISLDFDKVLERTVKALHQMLGIEHLSFALPVEGQTALKLHPSQIGYDPETVELRIPLDESVAGRAYRTGEAQMIGDVRKSSVYFEGAPQVLSELNVPVKVAGRVIAVLSAESRETNAFDEDDLQLFQAVAAQLGIVLENARLYQTLQRQRDELSQAYEELKEAERLRTELVQNVSHELRTPFTLVQGYIELLMAGDLGPVTEKQREALTVIRKRVEILQRRTRDLMTLDKLSRKEAKCQPTCVLSALESAVDDLKGRATGAGVHVSKDLPESLSPVLANHEHLVQAFKHLIDNAIKFSPDGGTVTLQAWEENGHACVAVQDEGIGIKQQHLDHIFDRFYQVDGSINRRFGGMGIGLALVWEIVEFYGGYVEVSSSPQEGSTFLVSLPKADATAAASGHETGATRPASTDRRKILRRDTYR